MQSKIYFIFIGWKPDIYESWDEAHAQVNKFRNASHKSYHNRRDVVEAFDAFLDKQASTSKHDEKISSTKCSTEIRTWES